MPRVSFYTLGCKLNYAESSTIARDFGQKAFDVVPFGEPADVTVINTCTVTGQADHKCRNAVRRALRTNPEAFVIVTGCYAQLQPKDLAAIDGVDAVLGSREKFQIFEVIDEFVKQDKTQISVSCIDEVKTYGAAYSSGDRTRAFLKIQDGCDYSCSFCTIPLARGASRSQSPEDALRQAREIAAGGYREIVLSGVNIGLFGTDSGSSLLALLFELDRVDGIDRFRISSIEPDLLTDEIIEFVAASEKFQPHFHIPLQSGDDYVLGKMRRRYRRDTYARRVESILSMMPDACIGADVIVGFPAESDRRFESTYNFLNDLPVSYLHVFTYSERENTAAVDQLDRLGETVPKKERSMRSRMLRMLSHTKRQSFYRAHLDEIRPVLWEDTQNDAICRGFTDNYIRVETEIGAATPNEISDVRLHEISPAGNVTARNRDFIPLVE